MNVNSIKVRGDPPYNVNACSPFIQTLVVVLFTAIKLSHSVMKENTMY